MDLKAYFDRIDFRGEALPDVRPSGAPASQSNTPL